MITPRNHVTYRWLIIAAVCVLAFCGSIRCFAQDANESAPLAVPEPNDINIPAVEPAADANAGVAVSEANATPVTPAPVATEPPPAPIVYVSKTPVDGDLSGRMSKKICIDFKETPIDDVLRILSQQAGVNIIKSPKVVGNVTATLSDIPLNEALNNILAVHNYKYITGENMIRVVPVEDVSAEQIKTSSKIFHIQYASAKDVAESLVNLLSKNSQGKEIGRIALAIGTSDIIVTDTEENLAAISDFIARIDKVTQQVLVEARIYDVTTDDSLDLGIKWQAGRIGADQTTTLSGGGSSAEGITNSPYLGGEVGAVGNVLVDPAGKSKTDPFATGTFNAGTNYTDSGDGMLRFGFLNKYVNIDALLKAEQKSGSAKLLASPRVMVVDNEKANINIVQEVPYQDISQTSGGGNIGSTQFKEVGVTLDVIPHITTEGLVRMQLKPTFSTVVRYVNVSVPGTAVVSQIPVIDKRETNTIALVRDGETVVLGGLLKKTTVETLNKVPLLGDIPLVGVLFRFKGENDVNSELVVFITPHIVNQPVLTPHEALRLQQSEIVPPCDKEKLLLDKLKKD